MLQIGAKGVEPIALVPEFQLWELRHRTRNNLQTVAALLRIEARQTRREESAKALMEAADRIAAFQRINDLLETVDGAVTTPRAILKGLMRWIDQGMVGTRPIMLETEASDAIIPAQLGAGIGVIANELITNSLKHAFPDDRPGIVRTECRSSPAGLDLMIRDDGIGVPKHVALGAGLGLVRQLVEQLGGMFSHEDTRPGTTWHVRLPLNGRT